MNNEQPKIMVSLDNGATYQEAPQGVQIIYQNVPVVVDGEDQFGQLSITYTSEGRVADLYGTRADQFDTNLGTESAMLDVLIDALLEDE